MKKILLTVFLLSFSLGLLFAERYALVIGNSAYENIAPLNTPANDATDIAAALRGLGYDVALEVDVGVDAMEEAIYEYARRLASDPANEGFFWYAGHGVQADGENYLLPVDIEADTIRQVERASCSLSDLMLELENARNRVNVFIIDACRNNNLPSQTRSTTRGLAVVPTVQDTFVMFSTAPGAVADDGAPGARNSPFTEAFLMHIGSPGRLDDMADAVARDTIRITGNNQRPYVSDNIIYIGNYSLNPNNTAVVIAPPSPAPGPAQTRPESARPNPAAPPANSTPLATGPRVPVQESRSDAPPRAPETFILDNTTVFSMALSYRNHLSITGLAMTHGGLFRYTFRESYKTWGEFFIAPNAYFLSLDFGMGDYVQDNSSYYFVKEFSPGIGVMWKTRPDAGQRVFLGFGLSINAVINWNADEDDAAGPYFGGGVHGNFTFRFTPLVALEFNAILSGDTGADGPALQSALGFSLTFPYGSKK